MSKDTDRDAQRCPNDGQTLAWHLETDRDGRTNGAFLGCAFGAPSLPVFLLARLDEDEAAANARIDVEVEFLRSDGLPDTTRDDLLTMESDAWRRPLADVAAKRCIVENCAPGLGEGDYFAGQDFLYDQVLRLLALPYADHEDYRPEWKP